MKILSRKKQSKKAGSLQVIIVLLIGSALLRLGEGTGQALARGPGEIETIASPQTDEIPICPKPDDLENILTVLNQREDGLVERETALRDRMHALDIAEDQVSKKLAQLERAEQTLRDTIALADTAAETDLGRLTRVYETMKPKQAAALFEEMDPNFAAGFLGRMRPDAAAAIMAGLSPEAAHLFSVVLAGRNANVPRE